MGRTEASSGPIFSDLNSKGEERGIQVGESGGRRRLLPLPPCAGKMASRGAAGSPVPVEKMSLEQLKAIKEQSDLEVNLLQDSLNKIRTAATRLEIASNALQDLSLRPQGISARLSVSRYESVSISSSPSYGCSTDYYFQSC